MQLILMVCVIPENGRMMFTCRGKAASARITWGASIVVPGRKDGGGHARLNHAINIERGKYKGY